MEQLEQALASYLPFWGDLTEQQRAMLVAGTRRAHFEAGAHVHSGENDCIGVLMVEQGLLRAYMLSSSGRECTLFRVGVGESCVLAATCVLSMITFDLFLDAEAPTDLLAIDPDVYSKVVSETVSAEAFTYRQTAERFSDVMWVMEQVLFMGLDARVAVFLLDEVARRGTSSLELTHDEVARHIGSAREAVSRMFKYFASEGMVALSRGCVNVLDKAALRAIVNDAM